MTTLQNRPEPASGLLVVDLDGTLVLGNSFHEFLIVAWKYGSAAFRFQLIDAVIRRVLSRHGDKRRSMKRRVLDAFEAMESSRRLKIIQEVLTRLEGMLSTPVLDEIDHARAAGVPIILATAAPAFYARPLAEALQLTHRLATESSSDELLGERKVRGLERWTTQSSGPGVKRPLTVITDHLDDLPLMRIASRVVLQGTIDDYHVISREVAKSAADIIHIDSVVEQSEGGYWLWFDDRPSGPHDVWELRTILSKHRYALSYVGAGRWTRIQPGRPLDHLVARTDCPTPPRLRQRLSILLLRRIVRDRLGIFH